MNEDLSGDIANQGVDDSASAQVTVILQRMQDGHRSAADELLPLIYDELHGLAEQMFRSERASHTLQPTALVHEAYLRLVNQPTITWQGRAHFYAVAAQAMRRILIHHAEKHGAAKRGGDRHRLTLSDDTPDVESVKADREVNLLALNDALNRLEAMDERQCRVVELRYFGGLTVDETAEALGIAPRTVKLDWQMARAWLYVQLNE